MFKKASYKHAMRGGMLLIAVALALAGCAQNAWYNPKAKQGQFESDRYSCIQQAQQRRSAASVNIYGGSAVDQQVTDGPIFASCMAARGWSLGNEEDIKRKVDEDAAKINSAKARLSQIFGKIRAACVAEDYLEYYRKTPCNINEVTIAHLADNSRITDAQKVALLKQREMINSFQVDIYSAMMMAGPAGVREVEVSKNMSQPAHEQNHLNLYSGKITWGEFNQRRRAISVEGQQARRTP